MITSLAKLGQHQHIQIILDYQKGGVGFSAADSKVTVTVLFKSKDKDAESIQPVQLEGTIAEVEAHLATNFTASIEKLEGLYTNIAEAEAALKKAVDEKKAEAAKPKTTATPAPKGKAKPAKPTPTKPDGDETDDAPEPEPTKVDAAKVPDLTPAWKKKATTVPAEKAPHVTIDELAALFEEGTPAEGTTH